MGGERKCSSGIRPGWNISSAATRWWKFLNYFYLIVEVDNVSVKCITLKKYQGSIIMYQVLFFKIWSLKINAWYFAASLEKFFWENYSSDRPVFCNTGLFDDALIISEQRGEWSSEEPVQGRKSNDVDPYLVFNQIVLEFPPHPISSFFFLSQRLESFFAHDVSFMKSPYKRNNNFFKRRLLIF